MYDANEIKTSKQDRARLLMYRQRKAATPDKLSNCQMDNPPRRRMVDVEREIAGERPPMSHGKPRPEGKHPAFRAFSTIQSCQYIEVPAASW